MPVVMLNACQGDLCSSHMFLPGDPNVLTVAPPRLRWVSEPVADDIQLGQEFRCNVRPRVEIHKKRYQNESTRLVL